MKLLAAAVLMMLSTSAQAKSPGMASIISGNSKVKAVVNALKQQDSCVMSDFQSKSDSDFSTSFSMSFLCSNNSNTEDMEFIDIQGTYYSASSEVALSSAKIEAAPTAAN